MLLQKLLSEPSAIEVCYSCHGYTRWDTSLRGQGRAHSARGWLQRLRTAERIHGALRRGSCRSVNHNTRPLWACHSQMLRGWKSGQWEEGGASVLVPAYRACRASRA